MFQNWTLGHVVLGCFLFLTGSCCVLPYTCRRIPDEPTWEVKEGMSKGEVFALLGEPNTKETSRDGEELWGYHIEEFGWSAWMSPWYVRFDETGKVRYTFVL